MCLNCLPSSEKEIVDMNEKEFDQWLQEQDFSRSMAGEYDVVLPKQTITTNSNCQKSETLILPLSLENNATTTGTAAIIEEFGKEFGVPCQHAKEYLPFDNKGKTFDLVAAREHHRFIASLQTHKSSMVKTVQQLRDAEKAFDLPTTHEEMESPSTVPQMKTMEQPPNRKLMENLRALLTVSLNACGKLNMIATCQNLTSSLVG